MAAPTTIEKKSESIFSKLAYNQRRSAVTLKTNGILKQDIQNHFTNILDGAVETNIPATDFCELIDKITDNGNTRGIVASFVDNLIKTEPKIEQYFTENEFLAQKPNFMDCSTFNHIKSKATTLTK